MDLCQQDGIFLTISSHWILAWWHTCDVGRFASIVSSTRGWKIFYITPSLPRFKELKRKIQKEHRAMAQFVGLAASLATIITGTSNDSTSKGTERNSSVVSKESTFEITIFALGAGENIIWTSQIHTTWLVGTYKQASHRCSFLIIVTALGLRSLLERYRIRERLRHYQILLPFKKSDSNRTSPNESSQIESLLHNNNCLSSHLHINRVVLESKQGIGPIKSNGVEWIHILKGTATICIDGKESQTLEQEDHCMISPWTWVLWVHCRCNGLVSDCDVSYFLFT